MSQRMQGVKIRGSVACVSASNKINEDKGEEPVLATVSLSQWQDWDIKHVQQCDQNTTGKKKKKPPLRGIFRSPQSEDCISKSQVGQVVQEQRKLPNRAWRKRAHQKEHILNKGQSTFVSRNNTPYV